MQPTDPSPNEQQPSPEDVARDSGKQPSPTQSPEPGAGGEPEAQKPAKPDDLDDALWDAEKGSVKVDDLLAQFKDLKAFKAETEAAKAGVPEKPEGYEVGLPEGLDLPEGVEWEPYAADHPVTKAAQQVAHDLGLSQEGFKKLVGLKVQADIAEDAEFKARAAEERQKLGDRGPARIDSVQTWLKGQLGDEDAGALFPMLLTASQIGAFENLISKFRNGGAAPPSANGREAGAEEQDLSELRGAERIAAARRHASKS